MLSERNPIGMTPQAPLDREVLIDQVARRLVGCGLEVPAVFFLEMNRPLSFITGQAMLLGAGVFAPFVGLERWNEFALLLCERDNVERLLRRIEELSADPSARTGEPPARAILDPTSTKG